MTQQQVSNSNNSAARNPCFDDGPVGGQPQMAKQATNNPFMDDDDMVSVPIGNAPPAANNNNPFF